MERLQEEPYHITFEIVNKQCKGLRMLTDSGIKRYALIDIRGLPEGYTRHLARIPSKQTGKLPEDVSIKARGGDKTSIIFDTDGCDVCKTILSFDSFLVSGRNIEDHTIVYSFVAPSFDAFKKTMSALETAGLKPKILEVAKFRAKGILTERQETLLWLALKMGYFDYPRKITMSELTQRLEVGLSTLSEITRRGIRRLLQSHFKT